MKLKPKALLFDMDGTLTDPTGPISQDIVDVLRKISVKKHLVTGSDYQKVEDCVKKNGDKSAQGIIDSLVNLGENWMDGRMNDDDITLVVIKKT